MNAEGKMQEKKGVIFFSSDDWDSGLKTSKYHMTQLLASDGYTVLYVNSIGLRQPTLSRGIFGKIWSRLRTVLRGVRRASDNIYVMTPFVVPFHRYQWVNRLNRWLLVWTIRRQQQRLGLSRPELWLFLPNHADLVGAFDESLSVYYVVDEHTLFDGVDSTAMKALDERLTRNVTLVVATANSLYDQRKQLARNILYLPHGVDVLHFRQALDDSTVVPADIESLPRPIIGFFGLIEEWIDLEAVAAAARSYPTWSFAMLGKIAVDIRAYADVNNMHFLGPRPYSTLPAYCKGFDCAILPFRITDMTLHVNPLKLREYLAAGLPAVSTDLPEVRGYGDLVRIAVDTNDFITQIKTAIDARLDRREVSSRMDNETWDARYGQLRSTLNKLSR
jgi:glycosyltransferase involved in cell wall biosynthesis